MNDRDQRRYERLNRVQTFGRENAGSFAPGSKAETHFDRIDRHLEALDSAKADQKPARVSKETLLDALLMDFRNIARTARAIALRQNGFASPYRLPDAENEIALLTHADALLSLLEDQLGDTAEIKAEKAARRALFTDYELPESFVGDLRSDREAVREAANHNHGETQGGVESTGLIGQLLGAAAQDVQELDAIMNNKFARQPAKLRAWQSASRVERAPRRETNAAPSPNAGPQARQAVPA